MLLYCVNVVCIRNMNTTRHAPRKAQNPLWLKVQSRIVESGLTKSQLAETLKLHRNTLRAAICSDLCPHARQKILKHLKLSA